MPRTLPRAVQIEVLHPLVEGASLRSASRLTGVHRTAIQRLVVRFGTACREFMDEQFRELELGHVQVDEIWTFVQKKQGRLKIEERDRHDIGDIYLRTCLDERTKLIPSFVVGKRSADNARRLMVDLASRINLPAAGSADDHAFIGGEFRPVIQISTDGFAGYREAVDLAFGPFARYERS